MNDIGLVLVIDPTGTGKLPMREDALLTQEDAEYGRLGITGVVEDESRPRRGARADQGAPEGSGASPVLEMVKAPRVLETNLRTVRLQDAAAPQ